MARGDADALFDWLGAMGDVLDPSGGAGFLGKWLIEEAVDEELVENAIIAAEETAQAMVSNAGQQALIDAVFEDVPIEEIQDGMTLYEHAEEVLGEDISGVEVIISEADTIMGQKLETAGWISFAVGMAL